MDLNNFEFDVDGWHIEMIAGELTINSIMYQQDYEDPTYNLVREIARLRGFIK